jgi:hypothetical protein
MKAEVNSITLMLRKFLAIYMDAIETKSIRGELYANLV